tara:strand:+ start:224 stop:418 length:195 start_codon:yes stop_codon:yes gene_type:complete
MLNHSPNNETSAETMSRCVKYFKERLDQETKTNSYQQYYADKRNYDKIVLTDYANHLINKVYNK